MNTASLKAELRQELKLTPQLLQSMKILQMSSQDLIDYLSRAAEENPILDLQDNTTFRDVFKELQQKASWLDTGTFEASFSHENSTSPEQGTTDSETESLIYFLCDQLERKSLPKPLLALSKYIANLIDEDGYLSSEDLDSLYDLKIPKKLINEALITIQSLDPAGVGARSLSECLLLQLARKKDVSSATIQVVSSFLPELSKKHYGVIKKELGFTVEEILAAEKVISSLDPYPGRAYQPKENSNTYICPDIFLVELDGEIKVILNEYYLPRVTINSYYENLLRNSNEQETKEYLNHKMQQAKWLLNCLERRGSTLRRCAEEIADIQRSFFSQKNTELNPMSISSLAASLNVHPSTVSRAIRGKYLQCRQGCFPLKYFFNHAVRENGPSSQAVKQMILKLIKSEDPKHPLSDQQICQLLSRQGITIARRTVAKYRIGFGLGASTVRKKREVDTK